MAIEKRDSDIAFIGTDRNPARADLKALRTGIGAGLQAFYSHILQEKLADRIAELVEHLDQQLKQQDQHKDTDFS